MNYELGKVIFVQYLSNSITIRLTLVNQICEIDFSIMENREVEGLNNNLNERQSLF